MKRNLTICLLALTLTTPIWAAESPDTGLIYRIFRYASTVDRSDMADSVSFAYNRFRFSIDRKDPTLLLVPSVYTIAHSGEREYVGESYSRVTFHNQRGFYAEPVLRFTTVPRQHHTMMVLAKYLTPNIYNETVIEDYLLSPFNRGNRRYYRYSVSDNGNGLAEVFFMPRRKNTQLVNGDAIVEISTGRVISCSFSGEYDMINFWLTIEMGRDGWRSLMPKKCVLRSRFRFIRNKINGRMVAYYDLPKILPDSLEEDYDYQKMCLVRPDTLESLEQSIYDKAFIAKQVSDSIQQIKAGMLPKNNWVKTVLWDMIGDNVLNHVKTHFGLNNQGYMRLNPILNPLYMGYNNNKGFIYKFDLRFSYQFNNNTEFSTRLKAGYAFKQHQFYYRLPVFLYFNKRKNGYFQIEVGNGNHIRNQSVRRDIELQQPDTTGLNLPNFDLLNEFKQNDFRFIFNYNFHSRLGFQIGSLYQRRVALYKQPFEALRWEWKYSSFAPFVELQIRPWGWAGPVFTADYDRSIKGILKSNTGYERFELNADYIHRIHKLQSIQMRIGTGFYTWKDSKAYFLNYENFQENNLYGGWNDDWSGEFELLRSDTYNTSDYYLRANVSYESPLLMLSWLPWLGHYMEMERIYCSVLDVRNVHPYVELGYGFTTRLISCGFFVSNGHGNRSFGFKFGFELFRHW